MKRYTPRLSGWHDMLPALSKPPYSSTSIQYTHRLLSDITSVVIHHTGSDYYRDGTAYRHFLAAAAYHVRRGWPGIGYHYGIDERGHCYWLGPADTIRWHAGNWRINQTSIAIVLPGNFTERVPTVLQVAGVERLLLRLDEIVSEAAGREVKLSVEPHSAVRLGYTECPGNTIRSKWIDYWRGRGA